MLKSFIPLAKPNINEIDIKLVNEVLLSGMLVQGNYVSQLEQVFTHFTKSIYASALSNGTATLHLALKALNIGPGDEVIVPAFSYVATANVVEIVGAKPVFVDIELETYNIDVSKIETAITSNTKAIIPVHEFGLACDIGEIIAIAQKHNIYVIEDAACALGAMYNNKHVGTFGEFGSFSLHPRKAITSGEGGVLVTNNLNLDKQIKVLRNHGIEFINNEMEFTEFGFNYRMTDFQAALVYNQMDRIKMSIEHKTKVADVYFNELISKNVVLPLTPSFTKHTWQTFHLLIDEKINRDDLIWKLKNNNIGANYGAQCIPYMSAYKKKYNYDSAKLYPNALRSYLFGLAIPIHDFVTKEQAHAISKALNKLT
jgi:perosamine synthetase